MTRLRKSWIAAPLAAMVLLVGCGRGNSTHAPAATGTSPKASAAPATSGAQNPVPAGLDPCLIGAWVSSGASGMVTNSDGTVSFPVSGGSGAVAVIKPDGAVSVDYGPMSAQTGTGTDGARYVVKNVGISIGELTASHGYATVKVTDPSRVTETITRDGVTVATLHPSPKAKTSTYNCTKGRALTTVESGITTRWSPAS